MLSSVSLLPVVLLLLERFLKASETGSAGLSEILIIIMPHLLVGSSYVGLLLEPHYYYASLLDGSEVVSR